MRKTIQNTLIALAVLLFFALITVILAKYIGRIKEKNIVSSKSEHMHSVIESYSCYMQGEGYDDLKQQMGALTSEKSQTDSEQSSK